MYIHIWYYVFSENGTRGVVTKLCFTLCSQYCLVPFPLQLAIIITLVQVRTP